MLNCDKDCMRCKYDKNGVCTKCRFTVELTDYPTEHDWMEVKKRALVTVGKVPVNPPDENWKMSMLASRHSPIRRLFFSFYLEIPYWLHVEFARHVHAQPYVRSQRNDRQNDYDRNAARQDTPVAMIWDMNAESLIVMMNKRLCNQASPEAREVFIEMKRQVLEKCPEFKNELVANCIRNHACYEMFPCHKPLKTEV